MERLKSKFPALQPSPVSTKPIAAPKIPPKAVVVKTPPERPKAKAATPSVPATDAPVDPAATLPLELQYADGPQRRAYWEGCVLKEPADEKEVAAQEQATGLPAYVRKYMPNCGIMCQHKGCLEDAKYVDHTHP